MSTAGVSRRRFFQLSAAGGGGLALAVYLGAGGRRAPAAASFSPSVFLRIDRAGIVTIWVARSEMGQGVRTALPMIVAEELEADWAPVRVEQAIAHPRYGRMRTGGSTSVRRSWLPLRTAGAAAREMLVSAAARTWRVAESACHARSGAVLHASSGRRIPYGDLVELAATLPVPRSPRLKDPASFRIIGTRMPGLDMPRMVDGTAVFGLDVQVPGMWFAAVARCPVLGGTHRSHDPSRAMAVPGVRRVVAIESGVAVLGDSTWAALKGREALDVAWNEGPSAGLDSGQIRAGLLEHVQRRGAVARRDGDFAAAARRATRVVEAIYEAPFLAHMTMEPMNCCAHVRSDGCEIWAPTQSPDRAQETAAEILDIPRERVVVHTTLLGGGFGRRLESDFVAEAVRAARAAGRPVKLVWTRADDVRHDRYRPASAHLLRALLEEGRPTGWFHRIAAPSRRPENVVNGLDETAVEGAVQFPYAVPHVGVEFVLASTPVPVGSWRAVYNTQNAFAAEAFLDEVAHALGRDPYALRRALLQRSPRHLAVLDLVAREAGWNTPPPAGRHRGIAIHECFGTIAALVVEVELTRDMAIRVPRAVCAVDCGIAVNPDTVEAQVEGAVVFGLSAVLTGEITIERGRVNQASFADCDPIRMPDAPRVEVHIVRSREPPGGIGEPGVPPVAPAVAGALFAATGRRIRRLPIRPADLRPG